MYSYVSAVAKRRKEGAYWENVSLGPVKFEDILKTYKDVVFTLYNTALGGTVYSTLQDMLKHGVRNDLTVIDWLDLIGNRYFDVRNTPYTITSDKVTYRDGIAAGYTWEHVAAGVGEDIELPLSERPDIKLNRTGLDALEFTRNALVTVNGLFHRVLYQSGNALVIEGGRTIMKADRNSIGIINASIIGPIQQISVTDAMVATTSYEGELFNGACISIGQSLEGKSVIMSVGGYLHACDDVVKVINDAEGIVRVDFSKINLLERLFDQRHLMSLASIPLSVTSINAGAITVADLRKNDVLRAYLTLPQSFIIVCDTPDLYKRVRKLECASFYNVYYTDYEPTNPIQMRHGLFPEVWVRKEYERYVLTVHDGLVGRKILYSGPWKEDVYEDPGLTPEAAYHHSHALEIEL